MRILVVGAGIIGVTSAHYLHAQGHEVTIIDAAPAVAEGASHANAGQVSWGYASPWAAPGIPVKALRWMFAQHPPLLIHPSADWRQWRWLGWMLRNCTHERYQRNKIWMLSLARYSQQALAALRAETGLRYDDRQQGTLQLFRAQKAMDASAADSKVLSDLDIPHALLSPDECVAREPGLAHMRDRLAGGLLMPGDETGDCRMFTELLADRLRQAGVTFHLDTSVDRVVRHGDRVTGLVLGDRMLAADAVLIAAGYETAGLLRPLGLDLPVMPVKGYSATVPITDPGKAPVSTILDDHHKIAVTRLGDRIRAAGIAELAGPDRTLTPQRCDTVRHVVADLFPGAADMGAIRFWTGLRPMTPNGVPIVGESGVKGLYLNTGHGTLGWTMACGSGRLVADIIGGRPVAIDAAPYAWPRPFAE
ncbi:D-amino acid dehydrogenase [Niveispirillum sp. KHB5.9]|uniref:D-amino acid dehydrogenase n=1 Tax=Niveispirillum sp. KHB5.9 TaxID=3400269 RepID=UPI003A8C676E